MKSDNSLTQLLKFFVVLFLYVTVFALFNLHGIIFLKTEDLERHFPHTYMLVPYIYQFSSIIIFIGSILFRLFIKKLNKGFLLKELLFFLIAFTFPYADPLITLLLFLVLLLSFLPKRIYWSVYTHYKEAFDDKGLLLLMLIALVLRFITIFITDNYSNGDITGRLWQSWVWANTKFHTIYEIGFLIMPNHDWLPLQHYFTGISYYITRDLVYAPRISMAIVGVLSMVPLYKVCKALFNVNTALLACFMYTIYASIIRVNIVTLSETLYIFSLLYSLYYFVLYYQNNKHVNMLYAAIFLAMGCMLRYEAWVVLGLAIAAMALFFKKEQRSWRYFLIPIAVFLFYLLVVKLKGFEPLRGPLYSDWENIQSFNLSGRDVKDIVKSYFQATIVGLGLALFINVLKIRKLSNSHKLYLFITLPLFIVFIYKLFTFTLHAQNRYFTIYAVIFLPFLAYELTRFVQNTKLVYIIAFFLVLPNFFAVKTEFWDSGLFHFEKGFVKSYKYVRENIPKGTFILDQEIDADSPNHAWMAYAGVFLGDPLRDRNCSYRVSYEHWKGDYFTFEKLEKALPESTHLVLFDNGEMAVELNFSDSIEIYKNYKFVKLFEYDNNYIYEIKSNSN